MEPRLISWDPCDQSEFIPLRKHVGAESGVRLAVPETWG